MLAFAALMLTGGTLGDLFGRKKVMLAGVAIFCAGSVVAAVAPEHERRSSSGRVVMGVGAAASEPGTLSLIRHIYPERAERAVRPRRVGGGLGARALARPGASAACSSPVPAGDGSSGSASASARSALGVAAVTLTESSDPEGRKLDVPGLVTGAGAIIAATFAVIEGENRGYGTWWIDVLFVRRRRARRRLRPDRAARRPIRCSSSSSSATRPSRRRTSSPSRRTSPSSPSSSSPRSTCS